ncbi:MAG TPA: ABC transporter ATP-binding protein [Fimbriimonas sp.]|nr:ABC transporter ATP-binding protein [Fimbriimonas sp.]
MLPSSQGAPRKLNRATLRRIASAFRPYRPQVILIGVLVLASALIGLLNPFLLKDLVNVGLMNRDLRVITRDSVLTLLATIGATGFGLGFGYVSVLVGQKIMRDLRNQLFAHLQGMPLGFFASTRTGELQSRITNDVTAVQGVVSDTVANILNNVTVVVSTVIAMFFLDWRLTLLNLAALPLFAWVAAKVGNWANNERKIAQERVANLTATTNETLNVSGALLTKVSGRGDLTMRRFARENAELAESQVRLQTIMRAFFSMFGLTFSITPILVFWLAGYLIVGMNDPHLTLGTIVAFTSMQARLFFPITTLLNVQVELGSSMSLFERIYEYLDLEQTIRDKPGAISLNREEVTGHVSLENVTFRYGEEQEKPTLSEISLEARPGELVALVGPSGAGKTSLTYLIPRLYDVEAGAVKIEGHDVRDVTLSSLANVIGVVTQETYLVHDTIKENLRYGKPDATDEEIEAAARAANIHDHIASLPNGYDSIVGERGYKLSGGEKQRIAIARAILKDPKVLILDEATSALDTQSERLIQAAIEKLLVGRTTFAIAHRLSTVVRADQILVIVSGRIVERGTHAELLEASGEYRRLYELQFDA